MSYKNKTYVAFASEDISHYRLMEAWRENENIDFNFYDAHDLFISRDTSKPETIKKNLRERMKNAKQVVLLISKDAKRKGDDGVSFLSHEIDLIIEFDLPVVIVNLDGRRDVNTSLELKALKKNDHYTMSTSFQPAIIKYALDNYCPEYKDSSCTGSYYYKEHVYKNLGI
ncbi:TIR domain-containing protein (plasmid) [Morganella morganii]